MPHKVKVQRWGKNMELGKDFQFENVWLDKDDLLRTQIKRFWVDNGALPAERATDERADQVLYLVRNLEGAIAGVCSAFRAYVPRLGGYFYHHRTFIADSLRRHHVAKKLLMESRVFLEKYNAAQTAETCLGIYIEVEAETLKYGGITVKRAIWQDTQFVFIGRSPSGAHLRVYYFPGALIEPLT